MRTWTNCKSSSQRHLECSVVFGVIAFVVVAWSSPLAYAQSADPSDVDRDLLEQLDDADEETIEPGEPAKPSDRGDGADSEPKPDGRSSIDKKLLEELDEGEDIPLGDEPDRVSQDLGGDVDPITRISEKMRGVERLLEAKTADAKTTGLQDEIVRDLEELLKQLKKQQQQQQQSQGGQGSRSKQQAQRSKINMPSRQPQPQPGQRDSEKPADDSEERSGKSEPTRVDLAELTEVIKEIWGHLPEKDRERLRQMSAEEIMPDHELAIEKYFRRLSEGDDD